MTFSLVLFLTLRFRRAPSNHTLFSRVVVIAGVTIFGAVAAYGVVAVARHLENERQLELAARSATPRPPTTRRRNCQTAEGSTQTDEVSETEITSEGYTLHSDSTSDPDKPTVSPREWLGGARPCVRVPSRIVTV